MSKGESISGRLGKLDRTSGKWLDGLAACAARGALVVGNKKYPVGKTTQVIEVNEMEDLYDIWEGLPFPLDLPGFCFAVVYWRGEKQQSLVLSVRGSRQSRRQWIAGVLFEAGLLDEGEYDDAWNPDTSRGKPPSFRRMSEAADAVLQPGARRGSSDPSARKPARAPPPMYQPPRTFSADADEHSPPPTLPRKRMDHVPWERRESGATAAPAVAPLPRRKKALGEGFGKPQADPKSLPEIPPPPDGGALDHAMADALIELELHCIEAYKAHLPKGMGGWVVTRSPKQGLPSVNLLDHDVVFDCNGVEFSGSRGGCDIQAAIAVGRGVMNLGVYNMQSQQYREVNLPPGATTFGATVRPCNVASTSNVAEAARRI